MRDPQGLPDSIDVVVVGAGQAGLATSYLLARSGIRHVVLERGEIGDSWRSQRWDTFHLNTPGWASGLPGLEFLPRDPDGFGHRDELVEYFEAYARTFELPIRSRTPVLRLEGPRDHVYSVETPAGALEASCVVLASGAMSRARLPEMAARLPEGVRSLTAGEYRNENALPDGAVVVVGSGQSGVQIAEDLLAAGRSVYVCASRVGRVPRFYRGRDIVAWWADMGILEARPEDLEDPAARFATQPHVSGTEGGHTVSFQSLARDGATLLGRATDIAGGRLILDDDLQECIAFADERSTFFKNGVDEWIERQELDVPPPETDPGEPPLPDLGGSERLRELDLEKAGVTSIVFCTGFDADWSWVDVDVFDGAGAPLHRDGIADSPGLYFVGMPWLSKRKSGILLGVAEDAERIVRDIESRLARPPEPPPPAD